MFPEDSIEHARGTEGSDELSIDPTRRSGLYDREESLSESLGLSDQWGIDHASKLPPNQPKRVGVTRSPQVASPGESVSIECLLH